LRDESVQLIFKGGTPNLTSMTIILFMILIVFKKFTILFKSSPKFGELIDEIFGSLKSRLFVGILKWKIAIARAHPLS